MQAGRGRRFSIDALFAGLALALGVLALQAPGALADSGHGVGITEFACDHVTFTYEGFPAGEDTVTEVVTLNREVVAEDTFTFAGPTGTHTVAIPEIPGGGIVDAHAVWKINGFNGGFDHHKRVKKCAGGYTLQKLQRIEGEETYTSETLKGQTGQTAEYEILVTNTGALPLKFSAFTDPECDEGTIAGGPGEEAVQPGGSTTFTCTRLLGGPGSYTNQATVTGQAEVGPPDTQTSNPVVIEVAFAPAFRLEKLQEVEGSGSGFTPEELKANAGETIRYEIVLTNTGNVPLTVSQLSDPRCTGVTGGPGATPVGVGESTTWFCTHLLTTKETKNGPYLNAATVKADPPAGEGSPVTHTSNTVVVQPEGGTGTTEFGCTQVVFTYTGFPNAEGNTISEEVSVNHQPVIVKQFVFNGPFGTDTVTLELPPGKYLVDGHAVWKTNGASGGFDHHAKVRCT